METLTRQEQATLEELRSKNDLSVEDLKNHLFDIPRRAQFVTFTAITTPRMRKTDNPYWDADEREWNIRKISRVNGIINFQYANSVENQREREGNFEPFEPKERRWGQRISGTPLVEHNDRYYLEVKVERSLSTTFVDSDGNEVEREEIEQFLYSSSQPKTQKTETPIILRDYRLESISEISLNGETFYINR